MCARIRARRLTTAIGDTSSSGIAAAHESMRASTESRGGCCARGTHPRLRANGIDNNLKSSFDTQRSDEPNRERPRVSHNDPNRVDPSRPRRAAIVISNPAVSTTTGWPVGFWWAELTHPHHVFTDAGWEVDVFSPDGGPCDPDAMSDPDDDSRWQAEDVISRGYKHTPWFMDLVRDTRSVDDLDIDAYDALVVAGGQGPMFTFERAENLHRAFADFHATGKVTAALCHGTAILRYARTADGEPLVEGRTVTGFANVEEDFADQAVWEAGALPRGTHVMPWRIEDEMRRLGANYVQAGRFRPFAIRDGNLVTGQQNYSGAEVARVVVEAVGR